MLNRAEPNPACVAAAAGQERDRVRIRSRTCWLKCKTELRAVSGIVDYAPGVVAAITARRAVDIQSASDALAATYLELSSAAVIDGSTDQQLAIVGKAHLFATARPSTHENQRIRIIR